MDSQELLAQKGLWDCPEHQAGKVCQGTGVTVATQVPQALWG